MTDAPTPDEQLPETSQETDAEIELEAFDVDHDGRIGVLDAERARLGVVDARLEEIAHHGGITGKLADVAHHIVDKLDNDS